MDRNQTIGLVIISMMIFAYIIWFAPDQKSLEPQPIDSTQTTAVVDSSNNVVATNENTISQVDTNQVNTNNQQVSEGKKLQIKTDDLTVTFNTLGGLIESVTLNNYKTHDKKELILFDNETNNLHVKIGQTPISDKLFTTNISSDISVEKGDSVLVTFSLGKIVQSYLIRGNGFVVDYAIKTGNNENLNFDWTTYLKELEDDQTFSLTHSGMYYYTSEGDFERFGNSSGENTETPDASVDWIVGKQRFFNSSFITSDNNAFTNTSFQTSTSNLLPNTYKKLHGTFSLPVKNAKADYELYFGPNDYDILKNVTEDFEQNVYLGWAIFGWVNRFLVLPIFRLLETFISNYGLIIFLLVVIIKLILFPIAYKSYLSMATMKELKPEIDAIKERVGADNMQAVQQESMKLYNQVGVNPISGCIPVFLQMPVLFALFNFFPNSIELRQESFLWAHDLSTYDSLITFGATIPLLGNHISLFTLLMTLSTLAYTYYNNQLNTTAQGPMKAVGYVMPLVFFFVLNSYAAGLTFYYFVSNIITIAQQLIATKFIDKDKIRRKLEDNKKNIASGKKKGSKFQQRIQEAMKAQQEARKKN